MGRRMKRTRHVTRDEVKIKSLKLYKNWSMEWR